MPDTLDPTDELLAAAAAEFAARLDACLAMFPVADVADAAGVPLDLAAVGGSALLAMLTEPDQAHGLAALLLRGMGEMQRVAHDLLAAAASIAVERRRLADLATVQDAQRAAVLAPPALDPSPAAFFVRLAPAATAKPS